MIFFLRFSLFLSIIIIIIILKKKKERERNPLEIMQYMSTLSANFPFVQLRGSLLRNFTTLTDRLSIWIILMLLSFIIREFLHDIAKLIYHGIYVLAVKVYMCLSIFPGMHGMTRCEKKPTDLVLSSRKLSVGTRRQ